MNIESPIYNEFKYTSPEFVVSTINCLASNNPNLQLIVVIFPNQREDRYNAVKRVCCVNYGIPSQVIKVILIYNIIIIMLQIIFFR